MEVLFANAGIMINHQHNENDARALTFLSIVHVNPQVSKRQIEREIAIPRSKVSRILKILRYHPHHITLTQALRQNHILMRIAFCHWV